MFSPVKGFLLTVPLKATRDKQRFWFWLLGAQFVSSLWYTLGTLRCAVSLFVVIHTGEIDSAVCSLSLHCDKHRGDWLCVEQFVSSLWYTLGRLTMRCAVCLFIVINTREIYSAVCSLSLRCDTHRGDWLCSVQFVSSLWYTPGYWLCGVQFVSLLWYTPGRLTLRCAVCLFVVIHTGEIDSAVEGILRSFYKIWISRRNWKRFQKYFSLFVRGSDVLESWKKNKAEKPCDTLPIALTPQKSNFRCLLISGTYSTNSLCPTMCFF